ncbi:PLP-dependent aminotransferase family protein [Seleniivibrio sp.]|uniref:aminotransferase-like domain-containing protein n=1 Tax=Seleniivibrio sp. TaxID=2898801 RepID=UPI0025E04035|nr:PLP-dependent aminotransferase family protein [Seleniivibrio sp.]MCD8553513.1 PLP-dependent aminotransferase family protein [Seleniivibrio sp.]
MKKGIPSYQKIADDIRNDILDGKYPKGSILPSLRVLSHKYGVSRFTINQALEILSGIGIIDIKHGSGCYVCYCDENKSINWLSLFNTSTLPNAWWEQRIKKEQNRTPFIAQTPGLSLDFNTRHILKTALNKAAERIFEQESYETIDIQGLPSLRRIYSEFLRKQGLKVTENELLIVSGGALAISIVFHSLLSCGVNVFHPENFLYNSINKLKDTKANLIPLSIDMEGISSQQLAKYSKLFNNAVLYTEPTGSEPDGVSISMNRKKEILDIIVNSPVPIIENEQKRYYRLTADSVKTFQEMYSDKVIYIDTVANVICPHLQVAAIVAPPLLIQRFCDIKIQLEFHSSAISQLILEEILMSDEFELFLNDLPEKLTGRCDHFEALLKKYCAGILEWERPYAGIYFWLKYNGAANLSAVVESLNCNPAFKLRIQAGKRFVPSDTKHFALCYTNTDVHEIESSILILCEELKNCM